MRLRSAKWVVGTALCLLAASLTALAFAAEMKPPLSVQWVYSLGQEASRAKPPVATADQVYVSYAGKLRCLDPITGAELWKFDPKTGSVCTRPVLFKDLVIVGADDSTVYAVSAKDGKPVWDQPCAGAVGGDPIILDDLLMFAAQEMVYALHPDSGELKWITSMSAPVSEGPLTDGAMLYFLGQDGSVQCIDAKEGRFRWGSKLLSGPNVFPPVLASGRVIVAGGNTLTAIGRGGNLSWSAEVPVGVTGAPTLIGDGLYVPCAGSSDAGQAVSYIGATQAFTQKGVVRVLFPRSGREQRTALYEVSGTPTSQPLMRDSVLYEATGNAVVYALSQETGAVLWAYRCLAADQGLDEASAFGIYSPLESLDQWLYAITGSGDLYCFSSGAADLAGPVFTSMKPESSDALPASEPVDVKFAVVDSGSGVDPSSIEATFDGVPVEVEFDVPSGRARFHIRSPKDGAHIVKASAKDWRGNVGSDEWSFLTSSAIKAAPSTGAASTGSLRRGGTGGAAGRAGGGRGGGGRGGGGGGRGGGGRGGRRG